MNGEPTRPGQPIRPVRLTPKAETAITGAVAGGNTLGAAAPVAAIDPMALVRWAAAGASPDADSEQVRFWQALKVAAATAQQRMNAPVIRWRDDILIVVIYRWHGNGTTVIDERFTAPGSPDALRWLRRGLTILGDPPGRHAGDEEDRPRNCSGRTQTVTRSPQAFAYARANPFGRLPSRRAMPRTGRPSKRTPQVQAAIIADVERGHTLRQAARRAGIHPATLRRWTAAGNNTNADIGVRAFRAEMAHVRVYSAQKLSGPVIEDRNGTLVLILTRRHRDGLLEVDERSIHPGSRQAGKLLKRRDLASVAARSGMTLAEVRGRVTGTSGRAAAAWLNEGDPLLAELLGLVDPPRRTGTRYPDLNVVTQPETDWRDPA